MLNRPKEINMSNARSLIYTAILVIAVFISACAPSRIVKPLAKKEMAVGATFGGPLIGFAGAVIPIPFTSVYGAYGIDSSLTVFTSVHTTSLAFGNFQTDFGITKQLSKQKGFIPALSISPCLNYIVNFKETDFNINPQVDLNAYWNRKNGKGYMYIGLDNWFDLTGKKMYGYKYQNFVVFSPQAGYTFEKKKWNINLECKYIAPYINNRLLVPDYLPFSGKGVIGIYFGVLRRF